MNELRELEIAVISDIHLGTYACKAKELLTYLKSIKPKKLILNGDIVDSWRFTRSYFPKSHLRIIRQLLKFLEKGTEIIYITGNHDEVMRNLSGISFLNLQIANQYELQLDNGKTWIFHGDFYDLIIHRYKWLARLGSALYGSLTVFNKLLNRIIRRFGMNEIIIYESLKERIKHSPDKLTKFEEKVFLSARKKNCQTVICGHIHTPAIKQIKRGGFQLDYINCGDWVEHCSAAEYNHGSWTLLYFEMPVQKSVIDDPVVFNRKNLYELLSFEFPFAEQEDSKLGLDFKSN